MTKKEAYGKASKAPNKATREALKKFIYWIYSDFESRTCANCAHFHGYDDEEEGECKNEDSILFIGYYGYCIKDNEMCNKFERKN